MTDLLQSVLGIVNEKWFWYLAIYIVLSWKTRAK